MRPKILLVWGLLLLGGILLATVLLSRRRPELGPVEGALRPCPGSPNCVNSQAHDAEHAIAPFSFDGDPDEAFASLVRLIESQPGARVLTAEDGYARAELATPVLRFVDDLELLLDPAAGVIHVRSASRVGHSDFGTNRRRVEELRAKWRP